MSESPWMICHCPNPRCRKVFEFLVCECPHCGATFELKAVNIVTEAWVRATGPEHSAGTPENVEAK